MPKKTKSILPRWYVSKLKKDAIQPKKPSQKIAKIEKTKDVNYTVPALLALAAIVLFTGLYFAQNIAIRASGQAMSSGNIAGNAIETPQDPTAATGTCEVQTWCAGTILMRQNSDCSQIKGYCTFGCTLMDGLAICESE